MLKIGGVLHSFFLVLTKHPILFLVLLTIPFSNAPFFTQNLAGITGLKPFNVLSLLLIISWIWKGGGKPKDALESKSMLYFAAYLGLFSFAFIRAMYNLDEISFRYVGDFPTSKLNFILSFWLRGALYTFSFIYILQLIRSKQQVLGTLCVLLFSFLVFDSYCIFISYGIESDGLMRGEIAEAFTDSLGLHYNSAATIIMIGLPIMFGFFLEFGKKYLVLIFVMALALILSSSRGALLGGLLACAFIVYMNVGGKFKSIIRILGVIAGIALISKSLIAFLSIGGTDMSIEELSNGRIELMWLPLLTEIFNEPLKLLFGLGMFGMIQSDSYVTVHDFFQATHAHNAYLNLIIDGGLLFLGILFYTLFLLFKRAFKVAVKLPSPIYLGFLASNIAYLFSCVFGRQFLPTIDNMFLFPIIALTIAYARLANKKASKS